MIAALLRPHGWLAVALSMSVPVVVVAQGRAIEDIRISSDGEEASIVLEFACEMRFVADTPTSNGALLEVRVAPFDSCRQQGIGTSVLSESYAPIGADTARLVAVEYDSLGFGDSIVTLSFSRPVDYSIRQRASLREVEIVVDIADVPARRPLSMRVVEPEVTPDFMINLQSTREPVDREVLDAFRVEESRALYVSQIRVDGVIWYRLRIGFFASEAAAAAVLEPLARAFPRAWIGRAEPDEIARAASARAGRGDASLTTLTAEEVAGQSETSPPPAPVAPVLVSEMMVEAREALLDGDNARAISLYERLAQTPGAHRPEAVEYLGLAYERSGQSLRARAEYERYLRDFSDSDGRGRVEQRLASAMALTELPRAALRDAGDLSEVSWDWSAGLAQYYRRDDNQFDQDQALETTQSALLTDADFSLRREGARVDMMARLSVSHYGDMLDDTEGRRGDRNRVSYGYLDLAQSDERWDLRLGRQSLHTLGVLGRFDGAHFSYEVGTDKRLHFTGGYPVESTRDSVETSRSFSGLAIEFIDVVGSWDFSAFVNSQSIDGVRARSAVGTEARYFDDRRSLTAMLDYDTDFGELNLALILGTWRLQNRMTLSALVDQRKSPLLSIRNALIGQPVETVDELLIVWSDSEVRQLALDRTAQSQTVTLGLAAPLGDRLQINFDVTSSEIDATVDSGGVAAVPGTGPQTYYSTSLVANGLFATRDVSIWSLRVGDSDAFSSKVLTWDSRFPLGRRLRINPRIRIADWQGFRDGRERRSLSPSLRLLLNTRNRYRVEFEVGRDDMTRTLAGTERDSSARYFNFGYRASF